MQGYFSIRGGTGISKSIVANGRGINFEVGKLQSNTPYFRLNLVAGAVMDSLDLPKNPFIICKRAIKC